MRGEKAKSIRTATYFLRVVPNQLGTLGNLQAMFVQTRALS
jgi:hypothetical protein